MVSGKLGDGTGRHVRCLDRVGSDRHANVGEQVAGRTAQALLKMADEGGARHVAAPSELGKSPGKGRLVKEGGERGDVARICCERQQPVRRFRDFARQPERDRE